MHGDHRLPYTCGSEPRRALIKYFYRNVSAVLSGQGLRQNMTGLLRRVVAQAFANYTDPASRGCLDATTGRCSLAACAEDANGFAPCLSTAYEIPGEDVAQFLFSEILLDELRAYFNDAHTSTLPLTAQAQAPQTRWGAEPTMAAAAAALSHFSPAAPTLAYSAQVRIRGLRACPSQPSMGTSK